MQIEIETVELSGAAYQRGMQHGASRKQQVQACIGAWIDSLRAAGIADPQAHLQQLLRDTDFLSAIREHCPDLLEEVHGIAAGAEQAPELLYAAQLMDEEWAYRSKLVATPQPEKCSSVALRTANAAVLIGQNMDLGGYTGGHQALFRLAPSGSVPGALILSISSMIALLGVNTRRIGVCVNSIPQLPARHSGLPVAFVIRKLLQARSLTEAVQLVRDLPHATSQHYLIADPSEIRSFEATPERVAEYEAPDRNVVLHTNHPLAAPFAAPEHCSINSVARLGALMNRLGTGRPDLAAIEAALSSSDDPDHPVSRTGAARQMNQLTGMISFTTGSMISELRAGSASIDSWVSPGPPSIHGYSHVSLACERSLADESL